MPTAVNSLFDDDSDDSGEEGMNPEVPPTQSSGSPSAKRTKSIVEGEEDEGEDRPVRVAPTEGSEDISGDGAASKPNVKYNEDDEDEEFDDAGAVVGKSATKRPDNEGNELESAARARKSAPPSKMRVPHSHHLTPGNGVTQSVHMMKLPNLVGLNSTAFQEAEYNPTNEPAMASMIRWRYKIDPNGHKIRDAAGKLVRESNARVVKWSDGSFTLHIGKEAFEVETLDDSTGKFAGLNGYLYISQKAFVPHDDDDDEPEATGATVLECLAPISSRFIPRPSSLQSAAHKALTLKVRQQTLQRAKIAEYVTQEDPEKMKSQRMQLDADLAKSNAKKHNRHSYDGHHHRNPRMNSKYLEDDRYYDSVNVRDLKRGHGMEDDEGFDDYGDDDDDDEDDEENEGVTNKLAAMRAAKKSRKNKTARVEEDSDDDDDDLIFDEDSDDEEDAAPQRKAKKGAARAVLEDDDDD